MAFRGKSILLPIMGLILLISAGTVVPSYFHQSRLMTDTFQASEQKQMKHIVHTAEAVLSSEVSKVRALGSMVETLGPLNLAIAQAPLGPDQLADLAQVMDRVYPALDANLFQATDSAGHLLPGGFSRDPIGPELPDQAVAKALAGTPVITLHDSPSGFSILAVVPARHQGNIVGSILVGQMVDANFTRKIAGIIGHDVTICSREAILSSSLGKQDLGLVDRSVYQEVINRKEPRRVVSQDRSRAIHYVLIDLAGQSSCLALVSDLSDEKAILAAKQKRAAVIGAALLIGALAIGLLFSLWFTRPIRGLIDAAGKMTLEITGHDLKISDNGDVHDLVKAFDKMHQAILHHQKQALRDSQDIRQKNEEWRSLVQNAPDIIIKLDRELTIRYMNRETHGVKPFQALGKDVLGFFHPDSRGAQLEAYEKVLATGKPGQIESQTLLPDGSQNWYDTRIGPIIKDGRVEAMLQISQDITDRKKAQQELQNAKLAAEQANHAKSIFLANMSHEIRTPMTSILGFADLLEDPTATEDQKKDYLRTIRHNGDHLVSVINDILDLSKIEAGQMEAETAPLDLVMLLDEVLDLMAVRASERGISLDRVLHYPLPRTIQGDKLRVRQILVNLVGNAIKFTEEGQVSLSVTYLNQGPEGKLEIAVQDSGIGMSENQVQKLFTPFTQADASTSRRFGGTGLGLAISRNLARLMGGNLSVTSHAGQGSTFTLVLNVPSEHQDTLIQGPQDLGPSAVPPKLPVTELEKLEGKILLAEDNPFNLRLATILLNGFGLSVEAAGNGLEACAQVQEAADSGHPFDLVLMDMMMPEMDGLEATRTLRQNGFDLPIIAFTANAMQEDRDTCLQAGCNSVATKPIHKEALLATLKRHLSVKSYS